jgi:hypothetical protein
MIRVRSGSLLLLLLLLLLLRCLCHAADWMQ